MTSSSEIRAFLMTRRERVQPEDVGLPRGRRRRVPGLRREEVAALAGVSLDYYVQVERGDLGGVSDDVLAALARALSLDETETTHLFDLARTRRHTPDRRPGRRSSAPARVPTSLHQLLDALTTPAVLQNGGLDIVAANTMGRAFYRPLFDTAGAGLPNFARYVYLHDDARAFFADWDGAADDVAAMLRVERARSPENTASARLVEELLKASTSFAQRWAAHDVHDHRRGRKAIHHPDAGEMHLLYEALEVTDQPGLRLFGYTPDPDHPATRQALDLLGTLSELPVSGRRN